jgi:hypothetical protein
MPNFFLGNNHNGDIMNENKQIAHKDKSKTTKIKVNDKFLQVRWMDGYPFVLVVYKATIFFWGASDSKLATQISFNSRWLNELIFVHTLVMKTQ